MENKVSNMWKSFLPSIVVFALQLAFSYIGMFLVFCLQAHKKRYYLRLSLLSPHKQNSRF